MTLDRVTLVGITAQNGEKALLTLALIAVVVIVRLLLNRIVHSVRSVDGTDRARFWTHQAINIATTAFFILALFSIWVGPNAHLGQIGGLIGAGVAFALQQFIIAIAGYFVILRGKHYTVGDRIIIGGVRGQVIALGFIQTTVLEMGKPPSLPPDTEAPSWVMARQYTGRIVAVSNGNIFTQPVYNYSREFPYIWEEIAVGIGYDDKYERAEAILLETAQRNSQQAERLGEDALKHLQDVYSLAAPDIRPRVFYRMTDELSVRFLVPDRDIREIKDRIYREILAAFRTEGIAIASGTYDIVGLPPIRLEGTNANNR